jgi:hypothetical protein
MTYFRLPEGAGATVAAGGGPLTVDAVEYSDAGEPTGVTLSVTVFLDGTTVRSAPVGEAPALIAALEADRTAHSALRQRIRTLIQGAVGRNVDPQAPNALTAAQRQALDAARLYKEGIIDRDGNVRPPSEWFL